MEKVYSITKWLNVTLAVLILGSVVVRIVFNSHFDGGTGLRVVIAVLLSSFSIPYILSALAYHNSAKFRRSGFVASCVWCLLIGVGLTSVEQQQAVIITCLVLAAVSLANIVLLYRKGVER